MKYIVAKTPGEAWVEICKLIYEKGKRIKDGNQILKEIINVFIEIKRPTVLDQTFKKFTNKKEMEWMRRLWLETTSIPPMGRFPAYKISYGKRLFKWKNNNQINWIVEKLKRNPESKSATISILEPGEKKKIAIPCSPLLDFKIRNGKLLLIVFFRSQDAYKKLHFDIYFLGKLAKLVAKKVGVPVGPLYFFVTSEHIYADDFKELKRLIGERHA